MKFSYSFSNLNGKKTLILKGNPTIKLVKQVLRKYPDAKIIDKTDNSITDKLDEIEKTGKKVKISNEKNIIDKDTGKKRVNELDSTTLALKRFREKEENENEDVEEDEEEDEEEEKVKN